MKCATWLLTVCGGALLVLCQRLLADAEENPVTPVRGRDPFVFRAIFEEKSRMCVIALRPELFVVYDPATCSLVKAFGGGIDFHGKVYDFSQQCSVGKPPVYYSQLADLARVLDASAVPSGFVAKDVSTGSSFRFDADGATFETPPLDLTRFTNVMIYFDEKSRRAPFRVEVSKDGGKAYDAQYFFSTMHRDSDTDWQENIKAIAVGGPTVKVRFVQGKAEDKKELRNLRIHGSYLAWSQRVGDERSNLTPIWKGYVRSGKNGDGRVTLRYALLTKSGQTVMVDESPEAIDGADRGALERRFHVNGLPAGTSLWLSLAGTAKNPTYRVSGNASQRSDDLGDVLVLEGDGDSTFVEMWGKP